MLPMLTCRHHAGRWAHRVDNAPTRPCECHETYGVPHSAVSVTRQTRGAYATGRINSLDILFLLLHLLFGWRAKEGKGCKNQENANLLYM